MAQLGKIQRLKDIKLLIEVSEMDSPRTTDHVCEVSQVEEGTGSGKQVVLRQALFSFFHLTNICQIPSLRPCHTCGT